MTSAFSWQNSIARGTSPTLSSTTHPKIHPVPVAPAFMNGHRARAILLYALHLIYHQILLTLGFPVGAIGKESTSQCRRCRRYGFHPWVGKIPWRRKWQPTPVFSPGEFQGQRSLVGYNPWDHKELDMTEQGSTSYIFM